MSFGAAGRKAFPNFTYTGDYAIMNSNTYALDGDYQLLALKSSGTLTFEKEFNADVFLVGGGAGGNGASATATAATYSTGRGGGGGGRTTNAKNVQIPTSALTVVIGAGGLGSTAFSVPANPGGETSITDGGAMVLSAIGGEASETLGNGGNGGSGGGSGQYNGSGRDGGSDGGDGVTANTSGYNGGLGQGTTTRAFGEANAALFAGGGGGGGHSRGGRGGAGGGGNGAVLASGSDTHATSGVENTGGGGGGGGRSKSNSSSSPGGNGGSGIILIRIAQG